MDLPRAEIRYHGMRAVAAAIIRRIDRIGGWVRPRAAPLAITALATLCMLAGLDLIAHDFRKLREQRAARRPAVIHLMAMPKASAVEAMDVIPIELLPAQPPPAHCTPASIP